MSKLSSWATRKYIEIKHREEGQGLAEYGLILALIAILCVGALTALQVGIDGILRQVAAAL